MDICQDSEWDRRAAHGKEINHLLFPKQKYRGSGNLDVRHTSRLEESKKQSRSGNNAGPLNENIRDGLARRLSTSAACTAAQVADQALVQLTSKAGERLEGRELEQTNSSCDRH